MLQEYYMAQHFGEFNSWGKRQAVRKALDVVAKNTDKKVSELANILLREVKAPIEIALAIFVGLGHLAIVQPTKEKGVLALHVSDDKISLPKEGREMVRLHGLKACRAKGPHGKLVLAIPWKTT
ncbi:MAG: hypothetical protein AAB706_03505 [Patescibacteria group bacterium]